MKINKILCCLSVPLKFNSRIPNSPPRHLSKNNTTKFEIISTEDPVYIYRPFVKIRLHIAQDFVKIRMRNDNRTLRGKQVLAKRKIAIPTEKE